MSNDFTEPRTLEDEIIAAADALGFKIAVPCLSCGRYLVSPTSIRYRMGARCRARAGRLAA